MAAPDLPTSVRDLLALQPVRTHHALWHATRNSQFWNGLGDAGRLQLTNAGWQAPRFEATPGAGVDFLFMHRQMIGMVDRQLVAAAVDFPNAPDPAALAVDVNRNKSAAVAQRMMNLVATRFGNSTWLAQVSLDELGAAIEWTIHGWIDDRIADWESANGNTADFLGAWEGPPLAFPLPAPFAAIHYHHAASPALLDVFQGVPPFIPMRVEEDVVRQLEDWTGP